MKKTHLSSTLPHMLLVLGLVSAGSAAILGTAYKMTETPIQQAKDAKELEAISEVLGGDFNNNPFTERHVITSSDNKGKLELYPARKDDAISGIAIKTFSNNGFGGKIEIMAGFGVDGTIYKYKVIDHKETPGLGTKVTEEKFSRQFEGLNPQKHIFKVKQDGGEIDAVTAATISSRAVVDALRRASDTLTKLSTGD